MIDRRQPQCGTGLGCARHALAAMVTASSKASETALLAGLILVASTVLPAVADPAPAQAPPPEHQSAATTEPKPTHETAGSHFSKFEARRIRHACHGRANDKGLKGPERAAFLSHCYFGRVSHRGARQACRKDASAKGLENAALHDFVRECVKERSRQKDQKDQKE
jgi:hypothetical protein